MNRLVFSVCLLVIAVSLNSTGFAANYPLEIINVDEVGSDNRIRYAYTGIEYKVRIAAEGGTYPFTWSLTVAPSGMNINSFSGAITWSNPTEVGSPHNVTVQVTDDEGNTDTESYAITVTTSTSRFIFVDDDAGSGGDGSIGNPYDSLGDVWSGHSGKIVYLRAGTYQWSHTDASSSRRGAARLKTTSSQPVAFLGYPGDASPVIDGESNPSGGDCSSPFTNCKGYHLMVNSSDFYLQGLTFDNNFYYGMEITSSNYFTVFDNVFDTFYTTGSSGGNSAYLAHYQGGKTKHVYVGNTMSGSVSNSDEGTGIKTYDPSHSVIEDNIITAALHTGIALKDDTTYHFVRHNQVTASKIAFQCQSYGGGTNNNEIVFNWLKSSTTAIDMGQTGNPLGLTYFERNTIDGKFNFSGIVSGSGPYYTNYNVIVNESPTDRIRDEVGEHYSISANKNNLTDNLTGLPADNIVDANGHLTSDYSSYTSTHGWTTHPRAPKNLKMIVIQQ